MDLKTGQVVLTKVKSSDSRQHHQPDPPKTFTFDRVFDWNCTQTEVFNDTALPIIQSTLEGYNGTIFAYGQTGTGKTHTMEGKDEPEDLRGIIPNTFQRIFKEIEQGSGSDYMVRASFLEIYNEEIRDLLSKNPSNRLELKENIETGVYVKDLTQFVVKGESEMKNVLMVGKKNRTVGATLMNQDSSRSHSIFTVTIEICEHMMMDGENAQESKVRMGKLNLVDLAGSERQAKTGATGDRLKEATKINLSLSALGNVISSLVDGKSGHIPYRDSKLTRLLQDSLGGNTKTVMIANIGPADYNFDETLSTLRYANRAKNIKNKPRINEDPKDAMLREFQDEINRLKQMLAEKTGSNDSLDGRFSKSPHSKFVIDPEALERMRRDLQSQVKKEIIQSAAPEIEEIKAKAEAESMKEIEKVENEAKQKAQEKKEAEEAFKNILDQKEKTTAAIESERMELEGIVNKIKEIESKVMIGNSNLLEVQETLDSEVKLAEEELAIQEEEERKQAQRIMELEEEQDLKEERYTTAQDEFESKSRKLKRITKRISASEAELADVQQEFESERADLLESIRDLTQQLKLKNLIISCCIPEDHIQRIFHNVAWSPEDEEWQIIDNELTGNHIRAKTRGEPLGSQRQQAAAYERMASALQEMEEAHGGKVDVNNEHVRAALEAIANDSEPGASSEAVQDIYFSYKDGEREADAEGGASVDASRQQSRRKSISGSKKEGRRRRNSISAVATSIGSLEEDVAKL